MELERPRPVAQEEPVSSLPPPPAPFPTEQIQSTLGGPGQQQISVCLIHQSGIDRQDLQKHISAVQRSCVDTLADILSASPNFEEPINLSSQDQRLAVALTELLEVTYDLESSDVAPLPADEGNSGNAFQALTGRLEDLQNVSRPSPSLARNEEGSLHPSILVVREELAWERLGTLSNVVVALIREKKEAQAAKEAEKDDRGHSAPSHKIPATDDDMSPPRYSLDGQEEADFQKGPLPDYASDQPTSSDDQKSKEASTSSLSIQSTSAPREKMLLELDGLTDAIGRLHSVTPRLNDQRVEMKASSSKTPITRDLRARAEREKIRELELIWDQIERTHGKRRMGDGQRVDMADWSERRSRQVNLI